MIKIIIDIEADGAILGTHSMISFGAVVLDKGRKLEKTFYSNMKPIGNNFVPEALAVSGFSREETLQFPEAAIVMADFKKWLDSLSSKKNERFKLMSDNSGFDASWINWYFLTFQGTNPFGHSSEDIGSMFKGIQKNMKANFKFLRKTKHTHNALDDAIGNAEALLAMESKFGLDLLL